MMSVIIANIIFMFLFHDGQDSRWNNTLSAANAAFTGIFTAEVFLKWIGVRAQKACDLKAMPLYSVFSCQHWVLAGLVQLVCLLRPTSCTACISSGSESCAVLC